VDVDFYDPSATIPLSLPLPPPLKPPQQVPVEEEEDEDENEDEGLTPQPSLSPAPTKTHADYFKFLSVFKWERRCESWFIV